MILYSDTSALIKKYVREAETDQVLSYFEGFQLIGAASLTQVEMAAAMTKAARQGWVNEADMSLAWHDYLSHWTAYVRLPVTGAIIERAARLAWQHGLRAYDAIHLACALAWGEAVSEKPVFACFDKRLRQAASQEGLQPWPED